MSINTISEVVKLKRKLYIELVKLTAEANLVEGIAELPEKMITKDSPRYRCCEFKERAIFKERIKLALGFSPEKYQNNSLKELAGKSSENKDNEKIVEVIELACDSCPIDKYFVTDACRNCVAHKCVNACPVNAIVIIQNKAFIDQEKCVECGKCAAACSYNAILENQRPCSRACEVDAITSNSKRQAEIDHDLCVSCGSCISACPFGAIAEKSELVSVSKKLLSDNQKTAALIAPSFVGQLSYSLSPSEIKFALKKLGFDLVKEVAAGAEKVAAEESEELRERVEKNKTLLSSCCPAFKKMTENEFPELKSLISDTTSPMGVTAADIKNSNPDFNTVFIGPCTAKKSEAAADENVDYVLNFEELMAVFSGFDINLEEIEEKEEIKDAGKIGRQFAYAGGLQKSLTEVLNLDFKSKQADGLSDCRKELYLIKAEKNNYSFLEGMACTGGCIGGPSAMISTNKSKKLVYDFAESAEVKKG